ncbi:DNA -binding domain-containing protein [Nguyenibacter vanlangensis]
MPVPGVTHHLFFTGTDPPAFGTPLAPMPIFDPWHRERLDATLAFWRFAQNPKFSAALRIRLPKPTSRSLEAAFMLWALDLRRHGASLREVAELLLGPMPKDWDDTDQRSFTRRLVTRAKAMAAGGYRLLLKPRRRIAR